MKRTFFVFIIFGSIQLLYSSDNESEKKLLDLDTRMTNLELKVEELTKQQTDINIRFQGQISTLASLLGAQPYNHDRANNPAEEEDTETDKQLEEMYIAISSNSINLANLKQKQYKLEDKVENLLKNSHGSSTAPLPRQKPPLKRSLSQPLPLNKTHQ